MDAVIKEDAHHYFSSFVHTCCITTFPTAHTLTRVTVQLRVDDVDFAVFLRFFRRFCRPRAGHQVICAPVLFKANQVERNSAELSRPAALQKHHFVVVRDVSVKTKVTVLNNVCSGDRPHADLALIITQTETKHRINSRTVNNDPTAVFCFSVAELCGGNSTGNFWMKPRFLPQGPTSEGFWGGKLIPVLGSRKFWYPIYQPILHI